MKTERDASAVSANLRKLLDDAPRMELGPGEPVGHALLKKMSAEDFGTKDKQAARACKAGVLLRFNHFDESHAISQELETLEGSYWHGILHRREPDYSNAKYWFRRVPSHPIFDQLAREAKRLAAEANVKVANWLTKQAAWNASKFIDLCDQMADEDSAAHELCRDIQMREWELLFEYCLARANGR